MTRNVVVSLLGGVFVIAIGVTWVFSQPTQGEQTLDYLVESEHLDVGEAFIPDEVENSFSGVSDDDTFGVRLDSDVILRVPRNVGALGVGSTGENTVHLSVFMEDQRIMLDRGEDSSYDVLRGIETYESSVRDALDASGVDADEVEHVVLGEIVRLESMPPEDAFLAVLGVTEEQLAGSETSREIAKNAILVVLKHKMIGPCDAAFVFETTNGETVYALRQAPSSTSRGVGYWFWVYSTEKELLIAGSWLLPSGTAAEHLPKIQEFIGRASFN